MMTDACTEIQGFLKACNNLERSIVGPAIAVSGMDTDLFENNIALSDPEWRIFVSNVEDFFERYKSIPEVSSFSSNFKKYCEPGVRGITTKNIGDLKVLFNKMLLFFRRIQTDEPAEVDGEMKYFISHSYLDKKYAKALTYYLTDLGIEKSNIICTSVDGCRPKVGEDIFEWLRSQFDGGLHVIFLTPAQR